MPDEELEVQETEEEPAVEETEATEAEASSEGSEEGQREDETAEEYFLRINDRQVYKTQDDAVKAFDEAGKRIASYSRFGTPEEIAELKQKAELVERMFGKGSVSDETDPLGDLDSRQREEWDRFMKRFEGVAEQKGYVRRDKVEELIDERVRQNTQETRAKEAMRSMASERGIEVNDTRLDILETAAVELAKANDSVRELWVQGNVNDFVKEVLDAVYGPPSKAKSKASLERDENGQFKKRAEYQGVKEKAKELPKSPPKGAGAAATGSDEVPVEERINPKSRLARAKALFKERLGA